MSCFLLVPYIRGTQLYRLWMSLDDVSYSLKRNIVYFRCEILVSYCFSDLFPATVILIPLSYSMTPIFLRTLYCHNSYITTGFTIIGELDNASVDWKHRGENTVDWHVRAGTIKFPTFGIFHPSWFQAIMRSKFSLLACLYLLIDFNFALKMISSPCWSSPIQ